MDEFARDARRPWLDTYPDGIVWDAVIDTTPVHEKVLRVCARTPDALALDFLGKTTTYGALGRDIHAFAGALQTDLGVKKGDRVAILMPNCPFYVVAYYAALLIGATVVNCNPLYSLRELEHIVSDSGARVLVTLNLHATYDKAEKLLEGGHLDHLVAAHFPDALPTVKKLLFTLARRKDLAKPEDSRGRIVWFGTMVQRGRTPEPVSIATQTDVAVQQYTGGTTGSPKGAMLSHANIAANTDQIDKWGDGIFYPPSKVVAVLPFFHIFAMTVCLNVPLGSGAQVIMLPRFEIGPFLKLMKRTKPNVLPAVPTLLHALATKDTVTREHLASLQVAVSGGAGLPNETRDAFARKSDAILAEGYGLTEASPVVTCAALRAPSKRGSIGLPLPGTDVKFMDLENPDTELAMGERGELVVKGPQVMLGYFGDPETSRKAFTPEGYLRTADVGYLDPQGYVFLVDRIKDLIICSGFNVYPRAIEDAIHRHPAVDEVSVIGVPDPYRGEAPVAYVKLKPGESLDQTTLLSSLRDQLSKLEMPREVVFRDELPKTMIGKLSKNELRADYTTTHPQKGQSSEPA